MPIPADLPPVVLDERFDEMRKHYRAVGEGHLCEPRNKEERVCYCATCMEAYEAGLKLATQLLENQCPSYLAAVSVVMASVAAVAMARALDADPRMEVAKAIRAQSALNEASGLMEAFTSNAHSVEQTFRAVQSSMKRD